MSSLTLGGLAPKGNPNDEKDKDKDKNVAEKTTDPPTERIQSQVQDTGVTIAVETKESSNSLNNLTADANVVSNSNPPESKAEEAKITKPATENKPQEQPQTQDQALSTSKPDVAATMSSSISGSGSKSVSTTENDPAGRKKDALEAMDTSDLDNTGENIESLKPEDLLKVVKKYEPLIPVPVIKHYLERAGCEMMDDDHVRVVGLAAQKLIGDIVSDARIRIIGKAPTKRRGDDDTDEDVLKLTTADLAPW